MSSPRILTIDIETSPMLVWTFSLFKPFISHQQVVQDTRVICWAAKWYGEDQVIFRSEYHHGREAMLRQLHALLNEADVVIHFNGESFDVPHLRREFKQLGLDPFSPFLTIDLYRQLKKSMYFPSYKLDNIARQLGITRKIENSGITLWIECLTESPADNPKRQQRAWSLMRKYNKGDITTTEDLYTETRNYLPSHPNFGLFADDPGDGVVRCSVCNSDNIRKEGHRYTQAGKYPRFQCRDCGKWGVEKKAVAFTQGRGVAS